ncbi:hypothetical protein WDH52_15085 [Streptomyces sp. TRM70308]|uniref:hypothetical protein n=1 Tax=Streptomyces sp. TRM70308 TaxID=3131932 RepID=UPI003D02FC64
MNGTGEAAQDPTPPRDPAAPGPEPLRFYGTTWVDHSGGYALRRTGLALGAFAAAAAGAFVLRFAYQGLALAEVGSLVNTLLVVAFAVCTSLAFTRTWSSYTRRSGPRGDTPGASPTQGLKLIGFLGILLAYGLRTLVEAPGEKLLRAEYEQALARYERRRTTRTGNPAARAKRAKRRR